MDTLAKYVGLTRLPNSFRVLFRGMPALFRHRHQVVFQWLVLMHLVLSGPKTLKGLSKAAPSSIAEWRFRRLLCAGYWSLHLLLRWLVEETLKSFPPPGDQVVYVVSDGSKKDKRGVKNPAAQKGRTSRNEACFFGIRFVVLMVHWDVYRIPVDFRIVLPKEHPAYKTENELFREMLSSFKPPCWARVVIVTADAAFA